MSARLVDNNCCIGVSAYYFVNCFVLCNNIGPARKSIGLPGNKLTLICAIAFDHASDEYTMTQGSTSGDVVEWSAVTLWRKPQMGIGQIRRHIGDANLAGNN